MRSIRLLLGVLTGVILLQGLGLLLVGILIYQTTPQGVLARDTFVGRIPGILSLVRVIDRSMNIFYWGQSAPDTLPYYVLHMDPGDLAKIEDALPRVPPSSSYGNLFLQDENQVWVKGEFQADGEIFDVDVRVRGDLFNHWAYRKKSWRIRFSKEKLWRGIREITLIIPEDRAWFGEILNVERAQKFGLPQPPTRFVTMSLNGSSPMLYIEFEHWTKEMLEKLGFGDANLYQTGGGSSSFDQWDPIEESTGYWKKYVSAHSTPFDSKEEVDLLLRAPEKMRLLFDEDQLVKWYAHSLLAGSKHVIDHNIRLLFDRSRGRFIPIPWDVHLYGLSNIAQSPNNFLWRAIFADPILRLKVYRFLWEYVSDDKKVQSDIDRAEYLRALIERSAYRDTVKLPSNRAVKNDLDMRMAQVRGNFEVMKKELSLSEVLIDQRISDHGVTLDITARGTSPAVLSKISDAEEARIYRDTGDGILGKDDREIRLEGDEGLLWADFVENGKAPYTRHRFFVALSNGPLNIEVRNAVTGKKATVIGKSIIDERTFAALDGVKTDRNTFIRRYPAFEAFGDGVRLIGTHTFLEDVIIPKDVPLTVGAGTTVRMGSGVSMVSYSPVKIEGTSAAPVRFIPATKNPWGVLGVLHAGGASSVSWAEFDGGGQDAVNGTFMSGMVAFHSSPVTIRDSIFRHAHGDDALNIKYIPADLARLRFEDNAADAIDIDVASGGILEDSIFTVSDIVDSNGDGIDLSWSSVILKNVTIRGSGDKCISIGESSQLLIQGATLEGCSMGIAVKDGSKARAERVILRKNAIGIAGYVKKPEFAAPSIEVFDGVFEQNGKDFLTLSGATIAVDGVGVVP
ncbi:hypothetical protein A2635_03435 [Candidatus Peribacteria bacterium RIFCSPHIGHO2_01_FULL_51_9]|nr:MAG: hypothetical protein A2635_03435 [Candidatus Peribacteria bacterium RIFCSPHIGHO2_01_FULL_51_9]